MEFKIKKIETFTNVHVSAVKLTMYDGSTGWGQMSTYCADITCEIFHRQIIAPETFGGHQRRRKENHLIGATNNNGKLLTHVIGIGP